MGMRHGLLIDVQAQEVREIALPLRLDPFIKALCVQLKVPDDRPRPENNWRHTCQCKWLKNWHTTPLAIARILGGTIDSYLHLWIPNQEFIDASWLSFSLPRYGLTVVGNGVLVGVNCAGDDVSLNKSISAGEVRDALLFHKQEGLAVSGVC